MNKHSKSWSFGGRSGVVALDAAAPRVRRSRVDQWLTPLMDAASLALVSICAFATAAWLSPVLTNREFMLAADAAIEQRAATLTFLFAAALCAFAANGHYRSRLPFWIEMKHVVATCVMLLLADAFIQYVTRESLSRSWLLLGWAFAPVGVLAGRALARRALDHLGLWRLPTIVVGEKARADEVIEALSLAPELGLQVRGIVTARRFLRATGADGKVVAIVDPLLFDHVNCFVILAPESEEMADFAHLARHLSRVGAEFSLVLPFREVPVFGLEVQHFLSSDISMLKMRHNLDMPFTQFVKRAFDVVVSASLLVFLAPLLLVCAALVKLDGGPILFAHERVGRNRKPFGCLKFRTMAPNAKSLLEALLACDPAAAEEWRRAHKLTNDPRVTPIGRFLRTTSLDELPQLFNVLRGDMSLVGPRPIVESELETHYGESAHFYLQTRPGITGLWQVSGRSSTTYGRRVHLDVWYVRNWSTWYDIAILLRTIPAVLARRGAA